MGYTKAILDWAEEKYKNLDVDDKHLYLKSFGLGCIEGAIDGAVLAYPILLTSCIMAGKAIKKLKK